jgi:hypothetical protein
VTSDALVIDIGGDAGALIVYAPEELVGAKIEIAPRGTRPGPIHNVVRARQVGGHVVWAAVFPVLAAGRYVPYGVLTPPDARAFSVLGGRVTARLALPFRGALAIAHPGQLGHNLRGMRPSRHDTGASARRAARCASTGD